MFQVVKYHFQVIFASYQPKTQLFSSK